MEGKNRFFLLLLEGIDQNKTRKELEELAARFLNSKNPRQALYYYLNQLLDKKLIEIDNPSYSIKSYKLTHLGRKGKENLVQSEKPPKNTLKPLFRCHNLIVGFPIIDLGNFNFIDLKNRKISQMINWKFIKEKIEDYIIHIQDTGLLKIYCPQRYGINPDLEFSAMYSQAHVIAQKYCNKYDMKLRPMKLIRKGHKAVVNSEILAEMIGSGKINENTWVDHSEGTGEIEEIQDSYNFQDLFNMPSDLEEVKTILPEFKQVLGELKEQIELHLEVMEKIGEGQSIQNELLKELGIGLKDFTRPQSEKLGTTEQELYKFTTKIVKKTTNSDLDQIKAFWIKRGKKIQ